MRKKIVAGNWKMNNDLDAGQKLASEVVNMAESELETDVTLILITPFIHLKSVNELVKDSDNVFLGAQNCHQKESGAFTGEISAAMLKSVGVDYVVLGHSERREYFGETDELLIEKIDICLKHELTPIFCCGEPLEIRENGDPYQYVKNQISKSLFHLSESDFLRLVIAYEPIWAIGTGKTASPQQAQEMHQSLRGHIEEKYGESVAKKISILYGGSAKPGNAPELFSQNDVDGGLIGGASLNSRDFIEIGKSY